MSTKIGKFRILSDGLLVFYCPGCECNHWVNIDASREGPIWSFNGDYYNPTFLPSVHVYTPNKVCHSFIKDGMIEFLSDSYHKLKGQTVNLPDMED